jgi:hypothetical protein
MDDIRVLKLHREKTVLWPAAPSIEVVTLRHIELIQGNHVSAPPVQRKRLTNPS